MIKRWKLNGNSLDKLKNVVIKAVLVNFDFVVFLLSNFNPRGGPSSYKWGPYKWPKIHRFASGLFHPEIFSGVFLTKNLGPIIPRTHDFSSRLGNIANNQPDGDEPAITDNGNYIVDLKFLGVKKKHLVNHTVDS